MFCTYFPCGRCLGWVALTIFCVVIIFTLLRGKIPVGTQRFGSRQGEVEMEEAGGRGRGKEKEKEKEQKLEETQQDLEHTHMEDLPAAVRWVSLLGFYGIPYFSNFVIELLNRIFSIITNNHICLI